MKYEVVESKTGSRMSHTRPGETMGSTLFDTPLDACNWMAANGVSTSTHHVTDAKGGSETIGKVTR